MRRNTPDSDEWVAAGGWLVECCYTLVARPKVLILPLGKFFLTSNGNYSYLALPFDSFSLIKFTSFLHLCLIMVVEDQLDVAFT